jgi:Arm domain-containing DNA-binding protein
MGGRERQMGLGSLKTYGLADAREQARKCRQMVAEGQDPIAEQDARKVAKNPASAMLSAVLEHGGLMERKPRRSQRRRFFVASGGGIASSALQAPAVGPDVGRWQRRHIGVH